MISKQIQLYIDHNVRDPQDGGKTDGIRIRPFKPRVQHATPVPPCSDCKGEITPAFGKDARWVAAYTTKNYSVPLCAACAQKRREAAEDVPAPLTEEAPAANATEFQRDGDLP